MPIPASCFLLELLPCESTVGTAPEPYINTSLRIEKIGKREGRLTMIPGKECTDQSAKRVDGFVLLDVYFYVNNLDFVADKG